MFACYKQLHPPTTVSFCLRANFTSAKDENLIIVRNNYMDVYVVKPKTSSSPHSIVLVKSFELFGVIDSIVAVTLHGMNKNALLINFEDEAKVSVVQYDERKNDLKTLSLHYFEDDFLKEGRARFFHNQPIMLDPQNRFATAIICDSKLVILPFKQMGEDVSLSTEDSFLLALTGGSKGASRDAEMSEFSGDQPTDQRECLGEVQRQIIIDMNDLGIRNIKDYCFLNNYNEPTILFLHENEQTWSGRLAAKSNTSSVTAVSFDLFRKYYPKIWSVGSLPHDCYKLIALEESAGGGALVVGMNSIIHINQCATYGLSFNDFAMSNPNLSINFKSFDGPGIFFDTASCVFISPDRILVSLKDGELYVMQLDGGGSRVNNITMKKSTTTAAASCMCTLSGNLLFLGSKLGDSILYEYSIEEENVQQPKAEITKSSLLDDEDAAALYGSDNVEPGKKKRKLTTEDDDFLAALEQDSAPSNSFFSRNVKKENTKVVLKIQNLFTNIGPISNMAIADTSFDVSGFKSKTNDNSLSVIACSGSGRHGCLSVLNRSFIPDVQMVHKLDFSVKQMWTLSGSEGYDRYVIFSLEDSTRVYESDGNNLTSSTNSQFITDQPTINVGRMKDCIVQVTRKNVRFIDDRTQKSYDAKYKRDHRDKKIRASYILDPYVLLHMTDGSLQLITKTSDSAPERVSIQLSDESHGKITAVSFYKSKAGCDIFSSFNHLDSKYLCCLYLTDGTFEIYSLPNQTRVFSFTQFYQFHGTVFDEATAGTDKIGFKESEVKYPYVSEMCLRGIGSTDEIPHLIVRLSDDTLHIYRAFQHSSVKFKDDRLSKLRFTKVHHDNVVPSETDRKKEEHKLDISNANNIFSSRDSGRSKFVPFTNIGDYSGMFFTSEKQPICFFTEYSQLRVHPLQSAKSITTFTSYNNTNCSNGFMFVNTVGNSSDISICNLDKHVKYNAYWPVRKVLLRATPNAVAYHQETNTCLVFSSVPMKAILPEDRQIPQGRYPPAVEQKHTVRLFSGHTWQEMDKFDFDLHESVCQTKVVFLSKEEYSDETDISFHDPLDSRKQDLVSVVAVGTAYVQSERELCRGRIILFDLEPILGTEDQYKLNLLSSTSVKGPVTQVEQVDRYIICSVGNRIYTYYFDWEEKRMNITSFYDTQFYTSSLNTIRNFILYGDIYKSVTLLRWKEKGHRLIPLAKDNRPLQVVTSEFMVNNNLLGMAVTDTNKNIQIFSHSPHDPDSNYGRNLVPVCDFHVGSLIHILTRMKMREIPGESTVGLYVDRRTSQSGTAFKTNPNHQFVLFATVDGSLGYFAPINETTHRRLSVLQAKMYTQLEQPSGLHPKAFRLYKPLERSEYNYKKKIIDGQLLWNYAHLNTITQKDLARQSGTESSQILKNIQELHQSTYFF